MFLQCWESSVTFLPSSSRRPCLFHHHNQVISVVIEGSLYLMMLFHDNVTLIMMMMSREEEGLVGPWVAVGGSYPGSLAGWLRLHFPVLMMINDSSCTICVFISKISCLVDNDQWLKNLFCRNSACILSQTLKSIKIATIVQSCQPLSSSSSHYSSSSSPSGWSTLTWWPAQWPPLVLWPPSLISLNIFRFYKTTSN